MVVPDRRNLVRHRWRARLDEHVAILRVLEARARRRSAELGLRALEAAETARDRWLGGAAPPAEPRLADRLRRVFSRDRRS